MASFIDVYQPKPPVLEVRTEIADHTLPIEWALAVKNQIWNCVERDFNSYRVWVQHSPSEARSLLVPRNRLLPYFLAAEQARVRLAQTKYDACDKKLAYYLVGSMFLRVGAKGDDERLDGIVELIGNDRHAEITGQWTPLRATVATVAFTCAAVVANHKMAHLITPAEFAEAHRKVRGTVMAALGSLEEFTAQPKWRRTHDCGITFQIWERR
jgi:hypothetical protein